MPALAVVVLCLVGAGVLVGRRIGTPAEAGRVRSFATSVGQQATVTLDDGSRVILAPRSQLTVREGSAGARTLTLVGQAYFHVVSAAPAPFVVQTGQVTTRVLGTAFEVRAYADDPLVRIVVVSGRVAATSPRATVTVAAGTVAEITDSTATTSAVSDVALYTSWTTGRLVFRDTPVSAMLTTIGNWYGYQFHVTDSTLAKRRVIAEFRTDEPTKTLSLIEQLLNVSMTFDGSTITIRPRHGSRAAPEPRSKHTPLSTIMEVGK